MVKRKRRGMGEGSVYFRKDRDRWVAEITLENGDRKQYYLKTQKEAIDKKNEALRELKQGKLATGPQMTVAQHLEDWLENVHKPKIRINTYVIYRYHLDKHLLPTLGHLKLQKLTARPIEQLYATKLEEGYAAETVRGMHRVLRRALDDAKRWKRVSDNVCDDVEQMMNAAEAEASVLSKDQAKRLLEAAKGHSLEAFLTLAVATGMRRGEMLALRWEDINFQEKSIFIRHTMNRISGKVMGKTIVEGEPKTKKSKSKISLPQFVIDALQHHHELQENIRVKAGTQWEENDLVFCTLRGRYLAPQNVVVNFKKLLKQAGLPDMSIHELRHSAATILLSMNVHPKLVQELLRHSNIAITMNRYSHVLPSMQREMMEDLDTFFSE